MHNLEKMLSKMMVLKEEAVAMNDALKRSSIFDALAFLQFRSAVAELPRPSLRAVPLTISSPSKG